jgi:hypothetical protein
MSRHRGLGSLQVDEVHRSPAASRLRIGSGGIGDHGTWVEVRGTGPRDVEAGIAQAGGVVISVKPDVL